MQSPTLLIASTLLYLLAGPVVAAPSYASSARCGLPNESIVNCPSIDADSAHGLTSNRVLTTQTPFPEPTPFWASASVRSGFGDLGASAYTRFMGTIPSPGTASGSAFALATFTDTITVGSSTLAFGTAVDIAFTTTVDFGIDLRSSTGGTGNPEAGAYAWLLIFSGVAGTGYDRCYGRANAPGLSCTEVGMLGLTTVSFTDIIHTTVGTSFSFSPFLAAYSNSYLYNASSNPFTGDASAGMSALNSMHTYLGADAPVQFTSESGRNYAAVVSAVPEPATGALLAGGLILLVAISRRAKAV